jgi:hypothetical protein
MITHRTFLPALLPLCLLAAAGCFAPRGRQDPALLKQTLKSGNDALIAGRYDEVLADDPNNLDAVLGEGLALFQSGVRAKYPEAASYLRRFVDGAPENHPLRGSAKDALDFMSRQGGVVGGR